MRPVADVFQPGPPRAPSPPAAQPARVGRVTAGRLYVILDVAPGLEVGPVLWSRPPTPVATCPDAAHTHPQLDPPRGTRLLVLEVAGPDGARDVWALTFAGWPLLPSP